MPLFASLQEFRPAADPSLKPSVEWPVALPAGTDFAGDHNGWGASEPAEASRPFAGRNSRHALGRAVERPADTCYCILGAAAEHVRPADTDSSALHLHFILSSRKAG